MSDPQIVTVDFEIVAGAHAEARALVLERLRFLNRERVPHVTVRGEVGVKITPKMQRVRDLLRELGGRATTAQIAAQIGGRAMRAMEALERRGVVESRRPDGCPPSQTPRYTTEYQSVEWTLKEA